VRTQKNHSNFSRAILKIHCNVIPIFVILHNSINNFDQMKRMLICQNKFVTFTYSWFKHLGSNRNSVFSCVVSSLIGTDLLDGFLSWIKESSVTFVGGVKHADFKALQKDSLSTDFHLLPQSFAGDGVTRKTFESNCFLAMGDDNCWNPRRRVRM
jgi:hypothetical protein